MKEYQYVIVGGGMTADAAVRGIRKDDQKVSIAIIGSEKEHPYNRPPLTKGLWKGKPIDGIWRGTEKRDVTFHLGRWIIKIDPANCIVTDDQGEPYHYGKLLLATGGSPRKLPYGGDHIIYYRTFDDYQRLRSLTDSKEHFAVIGGGFIGSEITAALAMNGKQVTMILQDEAIGIRIYPKDLAAYITDQYRQHGVRILTGTLVKGFERNNGISDLLFENGDHLRSNQVIAGIGIQPNTDLAKAAGLEVGNGIVVDDYLETSLPGIYAAGDVAAFYNQALQKRVRVEHEDNANTMGMIAGQNMAGEKVPYHHQPFFYSDLFEMGYEAVGDLDSRLETFSDWREPMKKGVIYYLQDGYVRGVLLWNVWGKVEAARNLIAGHQQTSKNELVGRIVD